MKISWCKLLQFVVIIAAVIQTYGRAYNTQVEVQVSMIVEGFFSKQLNYEFDCTDEFDE